MRRIDGLRLGLPMSGQALSKSAGTPTPGEHPARTRSTAGARGRACATPAVMAGDPTRQGDTAGRGRAPGKRSLLQNAPVPPRLAPCFLQYDEKGIEDDQCGCAALQPTRPRRHAPRGSPRCRGRGRCPSALRLRRIGVRLGRHVQVADVLDFHGSRAGRGLEEAGGAVQEGSRRHRQPRQHPLRRLHDEAAQRRAGELPARRGGRAVAGPDLVEQADRPQLHRQHQEQQHQRQLPRQGLVREGAVHPLGRHRVRPVHQQVAVQEGRRLLPGPRPRRPGPGPTSSRRRTRSGRRPAPSTP